MLIFKSQENNKKYEIKIFPISHRVYIGIYDGEPVIDERGTWTEIAPYYNYELEWTNWYGFYEDDLINEFCPDDLREFVDRFVKNHCQDKKKNIVQYVHENC